MYGQRLRLIGALTIAVYGMIGGVARAQRGVPAEAPAPHQHESTTDAEDPHAGHDMSAMAGHEMVMTTREASGTAWSPDESPMYAVHGNSGPWRLMAHENAFLQVLHESGARGATQAGSVNWVMGMAERRVGSGRLGLRGMFSLEPWTIPGCGYPDLLATGEQCDGKKIHDRQHPHDLLMELAVSYDAPLARGLRWQIYGGPAGEPALGPVAFPHRLSAMPNPLAPIAHHWLDATHITFGVVTAGVSGATWKAEASVFNGREPDDARADLDLGALDSVSGRLWFLPTRRLALQVSMGRLTEAELGDHGGPSIDVTRTTASATYHRPLAGNGIWATTVAWGRNAEGDRASNAVLVETNLTTTNRDSWFGRFESVGKTPHDLATAHLAERFTVAKLQWGYTRYLAARGGMQPGIGGTLSAGVVPESLRSTYGRRVNTGLGLFLTLRPAIAAHRM